MKTINYTGTSKLISRIVHLLNRKAPLPLDGDGDAVWGTNGQVLTTDGNGNTYWGEGGGGGDVTDVEVNGTSVVNAQGVAEVTVPTDTSDLNNDSGFVVSSDLAMVATSGDYDDLLNKPTIPDELADLADDSTHRTVTDTQISTWNGKSDFSGSYNDLTDKPTIPTVNDGTLTIQQNGTTLGTFTANQSGNTTVNLTGGGSTYTEGDGIDITNDEISVDTTFTEASTRANIASGDTFATILGKIKKFFTDLATVAFSGNYSDLSGTPDLSNVAYTNVNNRFSVNQNFDSKSGTAGVAGATNIVVGNNKDVSTNQNSRGQLLLFGEGANYTNINAPSSTADRTISCPDADGTFALKEINNNFSSSQTIDNKAGTTTTVGVSSLVLGNATAEGNDGNAKGRLLLYGKGTRYATLMATNVTANRSFELPDASGTIALTSDISSRRYKENIVLMSDEEATKILDVDIVNYDYKDGVVGEDERYNQTGAIAEDVANLIPNAVTYADIDGESLPDGINYAKFIPYLIKMVQIQQGQIDALTAEVATLKGAKA